MDRILLSTYAIKILDNNKNEPTIDRQNRRIYGYFSFRVSGEEYDIRDLETSERVLEVIRNHATFRNLYNYFKCYWLNISNSIF